MKIEQEPVRRDTWAAVLFLITMVGVFGGSLVWSLTSTWTRVSSEQIPLKTVLLMKGYHLLLTLVAGLGWAIYEIVLFAIIFYLPRANFHLWFGAAAFFTSFLSIIELLAYFEALSVGTFISSFCSTLGLAVALCMSLHGRITETAKIIRTCRQILPHTAFFKVWLVSLGAVVLPDGWWGLNALFRNPNLAMALKVIFFVGVTSYIFVFTAVVQSIIASSTMLYLEEGVANQSQSAEATRRTLTTSFGSICIAAMVSPFKLLVGIDDSHAYSRMALGNMSYFEACKGAPQSQLAHQQVLTIWAWVMIFSSLSGAFTFIRSAANLASVIEGFHIMRCVWALTSPVLLKYEEDEQAFSEKYPSIQGRPVQSHGQV